MRLSAVVAVAALVSAKADVATEWAAFKKVCSPLHLYQASPALFALHHALHRHSPFLYPSPALVLRQAHNKVYAIEEEAARHTAWLEGRSFVARHNADPDRSWDAGLNAYSDLTWADFQAKVLMASQNCSATHTASWKVDKVAARAKLPASIDWRDHGALNKIKEQGQWLLLDVFVDGQHGGPPLPQVRRDEVAC